MAEADGGRKPALMAVAPPELWTVDDADRLDDLLHRTGGQVLETNPRDALTADVQPDRAGPSASAGPVSMVFDSVEEAIGAAAALRATARTSGGRWAHLRTVVLTGVGSAAGSPISGVTQSWAARLLREATAGQTLVTSAVAVRAMSWLPPGLDLAYRGTWRPAASEPADRVYELRNARRGDADAGASNLGWARAVLHGRDEHPADRDVVVATLQAWRSRDPGATVSFLTGESEPVQRCAAELATTTHAGGGTVLYGRCAPDPADRYAVYREAFGMYAARCGSNQLVADLEGHASELARLLPEVGAVVGGAHLARRGHPDLARLCDCLETWLTKMAQRSPVLLVLDHAELMTAASQLVSTQLAHSLSGTPVRFLLLDHGGEIGSRPVRRLMEHLGDGLCTRLSVA